MTFSFLAVVLVQASFLFSGCLKNGNIFRCFFNFMKGICRTKFKNSRNYKGIINSTKYCGSAKLIGQSLNLL